MLTKSLTPPPITKESLSHRSILGGIFNIRWWAWKKIEKLNAKRRHMKKILEVDWRETLRGHNAWNPPCKTTSPGPPSSLDGSELRVPVCVSGANREENSLNESRSIPPNQKP